MKIKCQSEVTSDSFGKAVSPREVEAWIKTVPDEAELEYIQGERGHQLDPIYFLRGIRARWEEER